MTMSKRLERNGMAGTQTDDRRWVKLYSPDVPAELTGVPESPLDAFEANLP